MNLIGTFWSLVPSMVAISLALLTKEVYSSLFVGVVIGAVFYAISTGTSLDGFISQLLYNEVGDGDGYGLIHCLSDSWNVGILIFLVILGTMVALMNKAGGSSAFGRWAVTRVRTKVSAQIAAVVLGMIIFIDDYFNCLTVGSVMKPITDRYGVTKEKLAYLIDSTAAPICIIAPISSWAAAVSGFVSEGENGIALFCQAIPFNFYAFFTIIFMVSTVLMKFDYRAMRNYEKKLGKAQKKPNDVIGQVSDAKMQAAGLGVVGTELEDTENCNGTVSDLVVPIFLLIVFSVLGMLYSGGFFDSTNANYKDFVDAFAGSDASKGLVIGSMTALLLSVVWFVSRKVLSFDDSMSCLIKGFESMVPAILILSLAWTLKSMTDALGATDYVAGIVSGSAAGLQMMLPAIIFVIAAFLAFATGTSWGTFGILIPICIAVFPVGDPLRIIAISSCMAGAVCGDHVSPISDTTIMASAGAQCKHVNHVTTQLPYALTVATISFCAYIVAGLAQPLGLVTSCCIAWGFALIAMAAVLTTLRKFV
ncbi:MAG: Na+/H+ antiporter NhaC family protein [Prevotella sp.]|nr:Na+/H+ antiporter NhaC family protein [Candidatus Prevotella equi]